MHPNSPACLAGLQSHSDYIIGADSVLHESEDLFTLVEAHEGRQLKLYVYNTDSDSCREITITPNSNWGGEGRYPSVSFNVFSISTIQMTDFSLCLVKPRLRHWLRLSAPHSAAQRVRREQKERAAAVDRAAAASGLRAAGTGDDRRAASRPGRLRCGCSSRRSDSKQFAGPFFT